MVTMLDFHLISTLPQIFICTNFMKFQTAKLKKFKMSQPIRGTRDHTGFPISHKALTHDLYITKSILSIFL